MSFQITLSLTPKKSEMKKGNLNHEVRWYRYDVGVKQAHLSDRVLRQLLLVLNITFFSLFSDSNFIESILHAMWIHSSLAHVPLFPFNLHPSSRSRDLAFHSDIAWSYDRWALRVGNSRKLQSTGRNEHDPTTMMNCKILRQHIVLCLQGWTLWCALGSVNMS